MTGEGKFETAVRRVCARIGTQASKIQARIKDRSQDRPRSGSRAEEYEDEDEAWDWDEEQGEVVEGCASDDVGVARRSGGSAEEQKTSVWSYNGSSTDLAGQGQGQGQGQEGRGGAAPTGAEVAEQDLGHGEATMNPMTSGLELV